MLGCRMIEVICLLALVLDCSYSFCCWFLPLEFSSFGLGLKGFVFLFTVHYIRIVVVFVYMNVLVVSLTIPSLFNEHEIWLYCVPILFVCSLFALFVSSLFPFLRLPLLFFLFFLWQLIDSFNLASSLKVAIHVIICGYENQVEWDVNFCISNSPIGYSGNISNNGIVIPRFLRTHQIFRA